MVLNLLKKTEKAALQYQTIFNPYGKSKILLQVMVTLNLLV